VALPTHGPSVDPAVRRNLLFDVAAWVGFGITSALLGSMLPAIARRDGLDPIGIALLAAIPYGASLLGVMAGRVGPRVPAQLAVLRAVGAAALAFVLVGPGVLWVVAAASIYWIAHFFGMPVQQRLWGVIYPEASRGRLLSVVSTGRYAAAGIALLVAGLLAAQADGAVVIAIGGLIGAVMALATSRIASPDLGSIDTFSVRRAIRSIWDEPRVRQLTLAHALFGGGMATAVPLVTLIQVDRLDLGLAAIGITGMVGAVATLGSLFAWGAIADRRGTVVVLQAAGILGVAGLALFAVAGDHLTVLGASVLVGLSNGGIEVAFAVLIANHVPAMRQAAATAGSNAIFGIRGLIAPVAVVALLQFGVIDIATAIGLCIGASVGGALLYLRAARGVAQRSLGRAVGTMVDGVRRGRVTVASGGHAVASAIGSRFAALR
jgi:Major Facilitator Superfamily